MKKENSMFFYVSPCINKRIIAFTYNVLTIGFYLYIYIGVVRIELKGGMGKI